MPALCFPVRGGWPAKTFHVNCTRYRYYYKLPWPGARRSSRNDIHSQRILMHNAFFGQSMPMSNCPTYQISTLEKYECSPPWYMIETCPSGTRLPRAALCIPLLPLSAQKRTLDSAPYTVRRADRPLANAEVVSLHVIYTWQVLITIAKSELRFK